MRRLFLLAFAAATLNAQKASDWDHLFVKLDRILDEQKRILKILQEADAPPPPVKVDVSKAPVLGMDQAPITIVEFTDYQCPFCNKFQTETFPQIHDKFLVSGMVRLVNRDFPLPMHKNAMHAAEVARCAEDQKHFWEMRNWMQSNPEKLESEPLRAKVLELGLDMTEFDDCMMTDKYKKDIELDIKEAQTLGVTGTPAFIIGKSGALVEGELITGAQPFAVFEKAILKIAGTPRK